MAAVVQILSSVQSIEKYWNEPYVQQKEKTYDALNYLPNNFNNNVNIRIRGISSIAQGAPGAAPGMVQREAADAEVVVTAYGVSKKASTPVYDSLGNTLGYKETQNEKPSATRSIPNSNPQKLQ